MINSLVIAALSYHIVGIFTGIFSNASTRKLEAITLFSFATTLYWLSIYNAIK